MFTENGPRVNHQEDSQPGVHGSAAIKASSVSAGAPRPPGKPPWLQPLVQAIVIGLAITLMSLVPEPSAAVANSLPHAFIERMALVLLSLSAVIRTAAVLIFHRGRFTPAEVITALGLVAYLLAAIPQPLPLRIIEIVIGTWMMYTGHLQGSLGEIRRAIRRWRLEPRGRKGQ